MVIEAISESTHGDCSNERKEGTVGCDINWLEIRSDKNIAIENCFFIDNIPKGFSVKPLKAANNRQK